MLLYTTPLCHLFLLVLYTEVYASSMPRVHLLALYQAVSLLSPCCLPVFSLWPPCGLPVASLFYNNLFV